MTSGPDNELATEVLLLRYLEGDCTPEERAQIESDPQLLAQIAVRRHEDAALRDAFVRATRHADRLSPEELLAYVDGTLGADHEAAIAQRAAQDPALQAEVELLRRIGSDQLITPHPSVPPPTAPAASEWRGIHRLRRWLSSRRLGTAPGQAERGHRPPFLPAARPMSDAPQQDRVANVILVISVLILIGALSGVLFSDTSAPGAAPPAAIELSGPMPTIQTATHIPRGLPEEVSTSSRPMPTIQTPSPPTPTQLLNAGSTQVAAAPTGVPAIVPTLLPSAPPNTIRIALQSPISGEWGAIGTSIRNGAGLAVKQKNKPLTDLGFNVEFVPFDDQSNPEQGRANAQTIIADPAVLCVVGHYNSAVTLAAHPTYEAANLVQISPGSTNPQVTDATDNVWRLVGRDDVQGAVAARFAREELKSQRAFVIHDSTGYGRGVAEVFRRDASANGPSMVGFTSYDDTQPAVNWMPFLDDIQNTNPDVIFFAGSYDRAGPFFKLARERGYSGQFLGSDSLDNPALATLAGAAVDGMHFTTIAAPVSAFPQAEQFAQDYKATYGQDAPPFSPESYDAATICMEAVARAARTTGRLPTRMQVLEAMHTLPQFEGISGTYAFNPNGDPQLAAYFVFQVNAQNWGANRVVRQLLMAPPS